MDAVFPILFALFVLAVGAIVVWVVMLGLKQAEQLRETFARVAADYGGTAQRGDLFSRPSARFNHDGVPVLIDTYSTGGKHPKHFTQVHIRWPDAALRAEIYPANFFTRIGSFLGMTDVAIGWPAFDDAYHISGNSPEELRTLLSPVVQSGIQAIRQFGGIDHIYVQISGGSLLIKKLGLLYDYNQLAGYVALCLELYEQALVPRGAGIEFVEQSAPPSAAPICQVCGEAVTANMVKCRSCKTPHHQDCWLYYGACSTYGCGHKRFVAG